jgi:hypothetical protein
MRHTPTKGRGDSAAQYPVTVKQSSDQKWLKWCVYTGAFGGVCGWYDSEEKAQASADKLRKKIAEEYK